MGKSKDLATRVGIDDNADATAITITSQENVGIGTASPSNYGAAYTSLGVSGSSASAIEGFVGSNLVGYLQAYNAQVLVGSKTNVPLKLVTNDTIQMTIDGSGRVTMPNQPAFGIKMNAVSGINATSSTQVASGTTYFNSSSLQQTGGSNFAVGTGRFTAPVSGFYQFNVSMRFDGFNGNYLYITLVDNGAAISRNLTSVAFTYKTLTFSKAHYLHANDYSEIHINCSGDTSVTLDSDSYFSGFLIG